MKRKRRAQERPAARRLRFEPLEVRRVLALLTVNSLDDTQINTDGVLTLREATEVVRTGSTSGLDNNTIAHQISGDPIGTNDRIEFAPELRDGEILLKRVNSKSQSRLQLTPRVSVIPSRSESRMKHQARTMTEEEFAYLT